VTIFSELQNTVCVSLAEVGLSWLQSPCSPQRRPCHPSEVSSHSGAVRKASNTLVDIALPC